MSTINILVCEPLGEKGLDILKSQTHFKIETALNLTKAQLIEKIAHFDCLLIRSQSDVDKDVIQAGKKLKMIGRAGVGIDNVDIAAAKMHNIAVINTPTGNSISTAEFSFALMIALLRKIVPAHQHVLSDQWQRSQFKGTELAGKTLGIIGLGNVGRLLAIRAQAFSMETQAFDPVLDSSLFEHYRVKKSSLKELLASSDIVSLHCGLNQHTKHLMNQKNISLMKKHAVLINAARGELVDTQALIAALDSGHLSGAAIDVYEEEPPKKNDPLVHHPKILSTPHIAASTNEAQSKISLLLAQQVIAFFSDGHDLTRVV
ncbi:MAG: hydroxyacid dehydrogenase [Myxococcales bacterium]|nr:hydroxyacid dehydrogenase [Myxococcales bacterium]USN50638.1 MAG: hydroxyacid dehydrogenase [Myxococcales bacterium]